MGGLWSFPKSDIMMKILCVFLGGGIGSLLRYGIQELSRKPLADAVFPWGTFGVNVTGSFLIGLFYALSFRFPVPAELRLFLTVGLCGGFTTFSTFSNEGILLLKHEFYGLFFLYALSSVASGLLAVLAGGWMANNLSGKI